MKSVAAIILAAGKGTRMKSRMPKVLHKVCGLTLLELVIAQVKRVGVKKIVVVVGYGKEEVMRLLAHEKVNFAVQEKQLGTGHAVMAGMKALGGFSGDVLVLDGDVYFDNPSLLNKFHRFHKNGSYDMSIMTTSVENPFGYGRMIRDLCGEVVAIREELDATASERAIDEINAGIYLFKSAGLRTVLNKIKTNNRKKEYYITAAVDVCRAHHKHVGGFDITRLGLVIGVNDRVQLGALHRKVKASLLEDFQKKGVTILEPETTYIEAGVRIGQDTVIHPFTFIEKGVRIGEGCEIGPCCKIRSGSRIGNGTVIGSFVEVVRSAVGQKTNIKHLSYIGDARIGARVNIGAGTITANYDGKIKSKTVIGDEALIGSNTVLIAPVTVGKGAKTGAGSVVLKGGNIPKGSVVFGVPARSQTTKK